MKEYCHDCKKEMVIKDKEIEGGKLLKYKDESGEYWVFKCDECFEKDPSLRNYRETEVYSRIVGYYRPVKQWNKGKRQEFSERVPYKEKI